MKNILLILFFAVDACNHITPGNKLSDKDIQRIKTLGLLENDERIIQFYFEAKKSVAGNFFTNKRMACYWLDENDESKNEIHSAFYNDIIAIDTVINEGATYSPYMMVTCKDSSSFKVCFNGSKNEIRKTFNAAIAKWKLKRNR